MRRRSPLAPPVGVSVTKWFLERKLAGQAGVLARLGHEQGVREFERHRSALAKAHAPNQQRLAEAMAANLYWSAWAGLAIRFGKADASRLPEHWLAFGGRGSPLCASCTKAHQTGTVKIALEGPITGGQGSIGVDMLRGAQLAVDQANAGGGVLGKHIDLVRADDRADPVLGKQVARRVIAEGILSSCWIS